MLFHLTILSREKKDASSADHADDEHRQPEAGKPGMVHARRWVVHHCHEIQRNCQDTDDSHNPEECDHDQSLRRGTSLEILTASIMLLRRRVFRLCPSPPIGLTSSGGAKRFHRPALVWL